MSACAKCGFELEGSERECPRCGVITAKARPRPSPSSLAAEPIPSGVTSRTMVPRAPAAGRVPGTLERIVRWIFCLPVGILAGAVSMAVGVSIFGPSQATDAQISALFVSVLNMGLAAAVALLVARALAPSGKPWVVIGLASVIILLNFLEISSAARTLEVPKDRIRVAEAVGFILVAAVFLLIELSRLRRAGSRNLSPP